MIIKKPMYQVTLLIELLFHNISNLPDSILVDWL